MPLTLQDELAQIDKIKGATFEQVLQNQELQKLEPFANYGLLTDVLRQQQDIAKIDPTLMTSLNGVMTSEKQMLQNRLEQTFIPQAKRDFEDYKRKYLEGLAIRAGSADESAMKDYTGSFATSSTTVAPATPATPTTPVNNPNLQTGVGVYQANQEAIANQQAQQTPQAGQIANQQTGVGVYQANKEAMNAPVDTNLQQTVEQQAQTLGNTKMANKDYINALFKAYHGRDANAQELAQFTQMGVQDALNAIKGGSPANQASPTDMAVSKADQDVQNIATGVTTQDILGGEKSLIDVVKELSTAMGFTDINNEIQSLDDQYAQDVMEVNNNPWLSEALRSKKITNLQAKYETKKEALVDRLALESEIVGKAVDYYNAEREYKQQMLFKQLDLQQNELDRQARAEESELDRQQQLYLAQNDTPQSYNEWILAGSPGTFAEWVKDKNGTAPTIVKVNGVDYQVNPDGSLGTPQVPKATPQEKLDKSNRVLSAVKDIEDIDWESIVGMVQGKVPELLMTGQQSAALGKIDQLRALLTLENMGIMKGVLSDADMKIITNASTALKRTTDEGSFQKELNKIKYAAKSMVNSDNLSINQIMDNNDGTYSYKNNDGTTYTGEIGDNYVDNTKPPAPNFSMVGGDTNKATLSKLATIPTGIDGGQCGRFVNNLTGLGVGDSYQSKLAKMDSSIKYPAPGMVFTMPYKDTGHTGFIIGIDGENAIVKDSNYYVNSNPEKIAIHLIPISKMTGFARV